jgi:thiol-disulfide isomerase/thioredoxin
LSGSTTIRMTRGAAAAGLVGILALAAVLSAALIGSDQEGTAAAPAGDPAPEVSFLLFDGTEATLAGFRGRPLVLNFWASWCPACVADCSRVAR